MLLALAPMFLLAQTTQPTQKARPNLSAEERAQKRTEKMTADLGLNAEQQAQVAAINRKYADIVDEMRTQEKADKDVRRAEAQKRIAERDAELKAVLTPEQYTKHQEMKAANQEKRDTKKEQWKAKRKASRKQ